MLHVIEPFYLPADVPFGMTPPGGLILEQRGHLERLVAKAVGSDGPPVTVRSKSATPPSASSTPPAGPTVS